MSAADSQRLVQHIRRLAGHPSGTPSDGELLHRYLAAREEAAFAALMRRHGPMVFSVCQAVLRHRTDAEDAFQAAFLILAQKAGSIRQSQGLGGWLQRVAYRVALQARADILRRRQREAKTARSAMVEPSGDELSWSELRSILHAELAALPERIRAPLVLCYLEGRTQEEAARQLGWPLSTVRGRLQRGREKLRLRLERRGVALTAALGAVLTGQTLAESAVPATALPTAAALALARGFLRPLVPIKLVLLLSLGIVVGGMALRSPSEPRPLGSGNDNRSLTVAAPKDAVDAHGDPLPEGAVARLGTVRFNHGQGLRHLFFAPDGKTIYSEGGGWFRVWDAATGVERGQLVSTRHYLESLVLTPDGKRIVSLNQGVKDVLRVWDLAGGKEIRTLQLPVQRLQSSVTRRNALSPDGRLAAINLPTAMRIFDLTTGQELYKLAKGGKAIQDVVFAADRLVTADTKQMIDLWDAQTGKMIRQFAHGAPVHVLASSPDGRWLATLEHHTYAIDRLLDKDVVRVWDLNTGAKKHTLSARPKRWFMSVCFSPDGKYLLASSYGSQRAELTIWDTETGERIREMEDAYGNTIAVSPDGSRLATGSLPGKFELWDVKTGRRLSGADSHYARAAALAFTPSNERVVLLGYSSLSTWATTTGQRQEVCESLRHNFTPPIPALSSDGRYALSFTGDWESYQGFIWDVVQQRRLRGVKPRCLTGAFSLDSSLLAIWETGKSSAIRVRDVASGREVRSFPAKNVNFPFLSFTADGKSLLAADKKIVSYDVASGKELFSWRMKPVPNNSGIDRAVGGQPVAPDSRRAWRGITASSDGTRLAVTLHTDFDRIALFDARTGKLLRRWSDSGKPSSNYEQLCFSPDGQLLASSDDKVIHLWETATGKEIRAFRGHRGEIEFLAFSHNGRRLASASSDSTVLIWDATGQPAKPIALTEATLRQCWNDLAGEDAGRAHRATWTMIQTPRASLPFLQANLHPVKPVRREQIESWIQDLDNGDFAVRQKAIAELEKLGELAEPALRRSLANQPTLEQRRRIEPMLAKLEAALPSGASLQTLRAVRVLEHVATPQAQQLLRELANGAEEASLTRAAQAARRRLNRREP